MSVWLCLELYRSVVPSQMLQQNCNSHAQRRFQAQGAKSMLSMQPSQRSSTLSLSAMVLHSRGGWHTRGVLGGANYPR